MTKKSEIDADFLERYIDPHIETRWKQLYDLEYEWGERTLRYLMLVNSGGAIATLSFMGAYPASLTILTTKLALVFFVIGIICIGIINAKITHRMIHLFKYFKKDVRSFREDTLDWEVLLDNDRNRAGTDFYDYLFPYLSGSTFILGCCSGGYAIFKNLA